MSARIGRAAFTSEGKDTQAVTASDAATQAMLEQAIINTVGSPPEVYVTTEGGTPVINQAGTALEVKNESGGNLAVYSAGLNTVSVQTLPGTTLEVSGTLATSGLTDTELRATAVPVSGPLTDTQMRATAVPVSGPLTDTQMRATAVPVSGPLTDTQMRATAVAVTGPLTNTQLRNSAIQVVAGNEYYSTQTYSSGAVETSAPADGSAIASVTLGSAASPYRVILSLGSTEVAGAGGFVDLVLRNSADSADIIVAATFMASGQNQIETTIMTTAGSQILRLRKSGNATAATTYRACVTGRSQ